MSQRGIPSAVFCLLFVAMCEAAFAQCDLQIKEAGTCNQDGSFPGIPTVGNNYPLYIKVRVVGTPAEPFRIKWTMANQTGYFDHILVQPGDGYYWIYNFAALPLDNAIPWSVTIDPDNVTGDINLSNNTMSGTFTPTPPDAAVEYYNSRIMRGWQNIFLRFQPGSGVIPNLDICFGTPTTHGAQRIIAAPGPKNANRILSQPFGVPVFEIPRTRVSAGDITDEQFFTAQLHSVRVNPDKLRKVTWSQLLALSPEFSIWTQPETDIQSNHPEIVAFVSGSLPSDFRNKLTPYDAARQLHMAVIKRMTYDVNASGGALGALRTGKGACGDFSNLLVACLRSIGIPAWDIGGFWSGDDQWHVRVEFCLSGEDWLVADPTVGDFYAPDGSYAYEFGYLADANLFCAVSTASTHQTPLRTYGRLQVPNFYWNGGATWEKTERHASLIGRADAMLAVGLGRLGTNGGWVTTHAGKDGGFALKSWLHLPWDAYNATGGGVHVAAGDVDGDCLDEVVLGLGKGGGGWIAILDDSAHGHALLKWIQLNWNEYNTSNGEVFPAVGDIDGDGRAEIVAGLGTGSQGRIEIFGNASSGFQHVAWRQVAWPAYNAADGTTHPAVGDLDGDSKAEIVLGLGSGSGGWIEVIQSSAGDYQHGSWQQVNWSDYNAANGTTWPAVGDIDGDGREEIVIGLGQGSGGWVEFLDDKTAGCAHMNWFQVPWDDYDSSNGETHPAVGNLDADSRAEIVFGLGRFQGHGGWLFAVDDATSNYALLGWLQIVWSAFVQDGGETFPALGRP